jgi:hypothetical protein
MDNGRHVLETPRDERELQSNSAVERPVSGCDICHDPWENEKLKHLPIYVNGSEGVTICPYCQQNLTEFLRALRSTAARAKKQGYLAGKVFAPVFSR